MSYKVPLNVSYPDGKKIIANVEYVRGIATIKVPYIEAVEKDKDGPFSDDGKIMVKADRKDYKETLRYISNYIESLFIKELDDADQSTSVADDDDAGGDAEFDFTGDVEFD